MALSTKLWILASCTLLTTLAIILLRLPTTTLHLFALTLLTLFTLSFLAVGLFYLLLGKEYYLTTQANRKKAQREAGLSFHPGSTGDYFHRSKELAANSEIIPVHLLSAPYNGTPSQPTLDDNQKWHIYTTKNLPRGQVQPLLPAPIVQQSALDILPQEQRLLLLGPSGSGKSSLLRHIVAKKLQMVDKVLLCDPHGSRPKWGTSIDAIGFGEDFDAILSTFRDLEWLHTQRIQEVARGAPERSFPVILCVIEELQALTEYFTRQKVDFGHYIKMFLTRTRKTSIDVIAVTQSAGVKAMGLEGFGNNREAFALARTTGRDGRNHKIVYANEYDDNLTFDAPPLWPDTQPVGVTQDKVITLEPAPTEEQYKILNILLSDPATTDYKISMKVWGKRSQGYSNKIAEVKDLYRDVIEA